MLVNNKICVFDFETDGKDPRVCSPVQLAALMVDPIKLEIVPKSEFNVTIKPEKLENDEKYSYKNSEDGDILAWHGKVRGCSEDEILASWKQATPQKQAWNMFINYLDLHHSRTSRKSKFSAPIASGFNIIRFDLKITDRLSTKYGNVSKEGESEIFAPRDTIDIMNMLYPWMMNVEEVKSISLDSLRKFFGIQVEGGHDALKDVKDCADILIRFLKLHKTLSEKITFKDAFKSPIKVRS
jgi:hypothetical protein